MLNESRSFEFERGMLTRLTTGAPTALMRLGALGVIACIAFLASGCSDNEKRSFVQGGKSGAGEKSFFSPTEDEIVMDEENGLLIIKDVINITFSLKTDTEAIDRIIASVNGEIVGYDHSVNFYQVRIKGADLPTIDKIRMKLLGDFKEVEVASRCPVSAHKDPYYVR